MNSHESTPIAIKSGLLPNEWKVVSLRDAIEELKNGFASGKRDENGIVQIRMNNVTTNGRLIFDSYLKVPIPENINHWLLKKGDFLFNNTNSIDLVGKSTIFNDAPFQCTFSNHFTRLRFKKELVLPELILYHFLILWAKGYFKSVAIRHVGQSAVHTDYLLKLQIPLPPLPEQRRIAEVLGTVDSAIQKVGGAIESTERLKKGLMQRLLTRGIGHERFRLSKELGCMVPEEWEVKAIGDIAETSSGGTPSRDKKEYFGGNIPWVKSGELKDNIINGTEEKITEKGLQNSSAKLFFKGTLLIALYGATVGKTGILGLDATTNQAICAILSKKDLIDQKFLQYFLISRRQQLISISAGGAQPNISQEIIRLFKIPLPPLPEQHRIAEILSAVDRKLELERRRKEKLERVKKGIMNDLLTGRKRTKFMV